MQLAASDEGTARWWPAVRRIDVVGLVLLLVLIGWVWWASEQQGADAGPLVWLLAGIGLVAVVARWATFFHATIPPALLALGIAIYAITTGDDLPHRLGPGGGSVEAAGAVFATATGAAAMVTLRVAPFWPRLAFGLLTVSLFSLTLITGSLIANAVAGAVLFATVAFLGMGMKEPRWVVVWPALVAVLLLLGSISYALLVPVGDEGLLRPAPELHARWSTAVDVASDAPLYGVGRGEVGREAIDDAPVDGPGWARHEPLQVAAETGVIGGVLLLTLLGWALAWMAQPGWRRGSSIAGAVLAGSIIHACFVPIWHVPVVPLTLAALVGMASMRGGVASWRLAGLWEHLVEAEEVPPEDQSRWPTETREVDEDTVVADEPHTAGAADATRATGATDAGDAGDDGDPPGGPEAR
jgi:hypothetical protein